MTSGRRAGGSVVLALVLACGTRTPPSSPPPPAARPAHVLATRSNDRLRDELYALYDEDQRLRNAYIASGMKDEALLAAMHAFDAKATARMKDILAQHGWPGRSLVGIDGANAAWLLVQHADADRAFQRRALAALEAAVRAGDAEPKHAAYLVDRLAVADGRPQTYGTQFTAKGEPAPIADPDGVDARRAAVGLEPLAEYREQIRQMYGSP